MMECGVFVLQRQEQAADNLKWDNTNAVLILPACTRLINCVYLYNTCPNLQRQNRNASIGKYQKIEPWQPLIKLT